MDSGKSGKWISLSQPGLRLSLAQTLFSKKAFALGCAPADRRCFSSWMEILITGLNSKARNRKEQKSPLFPDGKQGAFYIKNGEAVIRATRCRPPLF
ncbi:MAG: hypothetical protein ACOZBW_02550 [Thermodesulfobacteriota bacterium]